MRKHMVEMESLRKKGIKNGALAKKGNDVLILGEDWNRVCAPKQSGKMLSFVFWDNSDSNQKPSWDNQVSSYWLLLLPLVVQKTNSICSLVQ